MFLSIDTARFINFYDIDIGPTGCSRKKFHHHLFILFLFIFKTRDMSKSIQIKAGTTKQETALTVALEIHINTSIKHYSSKAKHTVYGKH